MSGAAWVDYGQLYVKPEDGSSQLGECFGGQVNGLCGAAVPGGLFLIVSLQAGEVGFTVELHEQEPPVGGEWEEVVEVSYRPAGPVHLVAWANTKTWPLEDLEPVDYRVRYCAVAMDETRTGEPKEGEPSRERYLLQFWPAPPEPDRIVRQTSSHAAYWHEFAREQPPPPPEAQRAAVERRAREEQERADAPARSRGEERDRAEWLPNERPRPLRGSVRSLARLDRGLVESIADADEAAQRDIARWVARRTCVQAKLADVDWIAPALDAMDRDEPLPPPFDDGRVVRERLMTDERIPKTFVAGPHGKGDRYLQQAMALMAVYRALEEDPLRAVCDTLMAGVTTFGRLRHDLLFEELREAFPAVA
ncbi:hypothetical protein LX88_008411 [Lentzea californiensis]|nr:hypothetical protein [Lentzea californiensis]